MKRIAAIVCLCMALKCAAAAPAEPETVESRMASYYSIRLEAVLMAIRLRAMFIAQCAERFAAECPAGQKAAAVRANTTLGILDLLTLFRQRVRFPDGGAKDYAHLQDILDGLGTELLTLAPTYELRLFGRYGATLRACPPEDVEKRRTALTSLQGTDLNLFVRLSEQDFKASVEQMVREEIRFEEAIRRDWAPGECEKAQAIGVTLLQHMNAKLEPWMEGGSKPEDIDVRISTAERFLISVAVELEALVNPGVRKEIIAVGKRNAGAKP